MCKALGTEPREDEIPITRDDLTIDTQIVLSIYDKLTAKWDGFGGQYLGKDVGVLPVLFIEYKVEDYDRRYAWDIIPIIDSYVAEDIAKKMKTKGKSSGSD